MTEPRNYASSMQEPLKTAMARRRHIQTSALPSPHPHRTLTLQPGQLSFRLVLCLMPARCIALMCSRSASQWKCVASWSVGRVSIAVCPSLRNSRLRCNEDLPDTECLAMHAGVGAVACASRSADEIRWRLWLETSWCCIIVDRQFGRCGGWSRCRCAGSSIHETYCGAARP
jgi:hypothetical protein